jgi:hypothetical protein
VGHIPPFLKIDDESVQRTLAFRARASTGIYRIKSTATTPLGLAELLGLALPFAMHLIFDRYKLVIRIAAAVFILLSLYAILLTDSRLGVVAALASVVFYLLIWSLLKWRREKSSILGPAIVLSYPIIMVLFISSTFLIGRLRNEFWGNGAHQASTESRMVQWEMAIPKITQNPFGYGVSQGAEVLGFRNPAGTLTIDSYFLSVLLELGVLGFLIYFGLFLRAVFVGARTVVVHGRDRETRLLLPLSVAVMNFVIVKSVFSQDANHPLIFMMVGAIVALTYRASRTAAPEAARH